MIDPQVLAEVQTFLSRNFEPIFFTSIVLIVIGCFFMDYLNYARPPGPVGIPVFGNLLSLREDPHKTLSEWAKHFGKAFSIDLGSVYTVVVSDLMLIKELLAKDEFSTRPKVYIKSGFAKDKGLLSSEGDAYQTHRNFVSSSLQDIRSKTNIEARIQATVGEFIKEVKSSAGHAFSVDQAVTHHVGNALADLVLGEKFDYENQQWKYLKNVQRHRFSVFSVVGALNYIPWIAKFTKYSSDMAQVRKQQAEAEKIYKDLFESRTGVNGKSVLDAYVAKAKTQNNKSFTPETISAVTTDVLNLSWATTATTVQWLFLYMATNPKIQDKVVTEIKSTVGKNKEISLRNIENMPYTQACILEVLRHRTPLPFGVPHAVSKKTLVQGYEFPKGAMIIPFLYGMHHDPRVWKNPEQFNPERHLDDDGYLCEHENILPFQSGKRSCPGEDIARNIIALFFVNTIAHFSFKVPKGGSLAIDEMAACGLTLSPKPFKLQAEYN